MDIKLNDKRKYSTDAEAEDRELLSVIDEITGYDFKELEKKTVTWQRIPLGWNEDSTTVLERLHCPYCHRPVKWKDFYGEVDKMDVLSADGTVVGSFSCPYCNREMDVLLAVLVHAEKKE